MLKNAQFVKRCKLCGRYFVLTDKRKRDFCDRPYKGDRTCKQVGAKLFYDQGMQGNDYLLAFLTEYNKVYSRRYRADNKLPEEFSARTCPRRSMPGGQSWRGRLGAITLMGKLQAKK